jgi:hypothetical protein
VNIGAKVVVVAAAEDNQGARRTKPHCKHGTVPSFGNRWETDPAAPRRRHILSGQPAQGCVRSPNRIQGCIAARIAVTQIPRTDSRSGQPQVRSITRKTIPAPDLHGIQPFWS